METTEIRCELHPDKAIEQYCCSHDRPCCKECKSTDHNQCTDVINITNSVTSERFSIESEDVNQNLLKCLELCEKFSLTVASNLSRLERERVVFKNTVTHFRRQVESHLDFLESRIMKAYTGMYESECLKLKHLDKEMKDRTSDMEKYLYELRNISSDGHDVSSFLTLRHISGRYSMADEFVQSAYADENFVSIDFTIAKEILYFKSTGAFGSLDVKRNTFKSFTEENSTESESEEIDAKQSRVQQLLLDFAQNRTEEEEIENRSDVNENSIETGQINSKIIETLSVDSDSDEIEIVELKKLDDDVLIMSDRLNDTVLVYTMSNNTTKVIDIGERPDCIAVIDKKTVAITQGRRFVVIVDVCNSRILQHFDMRDNVEGLAFLQNKLIVNCLTKGIQILSLRGTCIGSIPVLIGRLYLQAFGQDQIICTEQENNKIVCVNLDGKVSFSLKDESLGSPYGITVDNEGNIFIVGIDSESIFKISPDGNEMNTIFTAGDDLQRPYVMLYMDDGSFLVSNKKGRSIVRYKMENL